MGSAAAEARRRRRGPEIYEHRSGSQDLKRGTLRPGPRDVPTATYTYCRSGRVRVPSGSSQAGRWPAPPAAPPASHFHLSIAFACHPAAPGTAGRGRPLALTAGHGAGRPGARRGGARRAIEVGLGHRLHLISSHLISPRGRGIAITAAPSSSWPSPIDRSPPSHAAWAFAVNHRFWLAIKASYS